MGPSAHLPDNVKHIKAHEKAILGVLRIRFGNSAHAVVAITEKFNSVAVVLLERFKMGLNSKHLKLGAMSLYLCGTVKTSKEIIQLVDYLLLDNSGKVH